MEDTLTSGRITVVCAPEARPLIDRLNAAFAALYPETDIQVRNGPSREAVAALFGARSDLAVIMRELEPDERGAAVRGRLELEGYRFARDAIVVIVNPGNRVENLALDDLRRVYQGKVTRWDELGGSNRPIVPVIQQPVLDIMAFFIQQVMGGQAIETKAVYRDSDSAVVATVMRDPDAIGFVSLGWADRGAKALRLSSLTGLPYWKPDAETVYRENYPLTRFLNLYVRPSGARLAHGFITFVTSREGQKIVHEAGWVPTAVPVRFVRRSPLRSSH
ncbi:MAG TPA: substrate-binding domain-containing protein [Candidatus Limnocylindria bacterium]|nr:substrate-binding domain-containing protein [Candidatus Limnocylindria bacterium]